MKWCKQKSVGSSARDKVQKCTYSAQFVAPTVTVTCPPSTCQAVPLYETPQKITVQCESPKHSAPQVNDVKYSCACPAYPPPCPSNSDLWNLQFCRWWGWNWIRKREEMMNKQKDVVEAKSNNNTKKSSRSKSRKRRKRQKQDDLISRCRKLCRLDKKSNKISEEEKRRLNELYDTPCQSVTNPCNRSFRLEGEYACSYSSSKQSCPTVIQPCETRRQRCKCNRRNHQSWVCTRTESSSSDECCPCISACPRRPCGSSTEESVAYLSLRMERIKSDCEDNGRCRCACQEKCCSRRRHCGRNPRGSCNPSSATSNPSPCTFSPPCTHQHCRRRSPCRRRCSPPPRIPIFRKCLPPYNLVQEKCSFQRVHPCPVQMPKCTKVRKSCCCQDNKEYKPCYRCCQVKKEHVVPCSPCQPQCTKKHKIKRYTICCSCQQECRGRPTKCNRLKECQDTQSPCDSTPNPGTAKRKFRLEKTSEVNVTLNKQPLAQDACLDKSGRPYININALNQDLRNFNDVPPEYVQNSFVYNVRSNNVSKFLKKGVYKSPASGRVYSLNPKVFAAKSLQNHSNWPNPINFEEDGFAFINGPIQLPKADEEHKLLLQAVCEALMSSRRSDTSDVFSMYKPLSKNARMAGYCETFSSENDRGFSNENSFNGKTDPSPIVSPQNSASYNNNTVLSPEPSNFNQIAQYRQQNYAMQDLNNKFSLNKSSLDKKYTSNPTNLSNSETAQEIAHTYRHAPQSLENFCDEPVCFLDYSNQQTSEQQLITAPSATALAEPTINSLNQPLPMANLLSAVTKAIKYQTNFKEVPEKPNHENEIHTRHIFESRNDEVSNFENNYLYNVLFSAVDSKYGNEHPTVSSNPQSASAPLQHSSFVLREISPDAIDHSQRRNAMIPIFKEDSEKQLATINLNGSEVALVSRKPSTSNKSRETDLSSYKRHSQKMDNYDDVESKVQCMVLDEKYAPFRATSQEISDEYSWKNKLQPTVSTRDCYYQNPEQSKQFSQKFDDTFSGQELRNLSVKKNTQLVSSMINDRELCSNPKEDVKLPSRQNNEQVAHKAPANKVNFQYDEPENHLLCLDLENPEQSKQLPQKFNETLSDQELRNLSVKKNMQLVSSMITERELRSNPKEDVKLPSRQSNEQVPQKASATKEQFQFNEPENHLRCVDLDRSFYFSSSSLATQDSITANVNTGSKLGSFTADPSEDLLTGINRRSQEYLTDLNFISKNLPSYTSISDTSSITSLLKHKPGTKACESSQTLPIDEETRYPVPMVNASTSPFHIPFKETPKLCVNTTTSPFKFEYVRTRERDAVRTDDPRRKMLKRESPFSMFCVPVTSQKIIESYPQRAGVISRPERKLVLGKPNALHIREKRWRY